MTLGYACEKMGQVVGTLATGHGTLNERMGYAFHPPFWSAVEDARKSQYLPEKLLVRMEVIFDRLTALYPGTEGEGRLAASLNALPDSAAVETADEMLNIAYAVWREGINAGEYWWWTDDDV